MAKSRQRKGGDDSCDVLVAGAGPAGTAAALWLAGHERRVCIIDREKSPLSHVPLCWLNARAIDMLKGLGVDVKPLQSRVIREVRFHNSDLSKQSRPKLIESPGSLLHGKELSDVLVAALKGAGVDWRAGAELDRFDLQEDGVELVDVDGRSTRGRMLIAATGHSRGEYPFPVARSAAGAPRWMASAMAKIRGGGKKASASVDVVFGLDRREAFAIVMQSESHLVVTVSAGGNAENARNMLAELCPRLVSADVIASDPTQKGGAVSMRASTAGAALEMEAHVAKHTLVVGDAGGFVAAASEEGIYPALWSGALAAEVMHEALDSRHSQDTLMMFDSKWRMGMAEYLRAPNTDVQFILPLVFSNQSMADRMAASFFLGENI